LRAQEEVAARAGLRDQVRPIEQGKPANYLPGPSDQTLRDPAVPFRWKGLSANDAELLAGFLEVMPSSPDELHTHVPVGLVPVTHDDMDDADTAELMAVLWPRRVDAACRWGDEWYLIECKPDAAHYVVGQMLCYYFWWVRERPDLPAPTLVLVTDKCDDDVLPVLESLGIVVVELGRRRERVEVEDGLA